MTLTWRLLLGILEANCTAGLTMSIVSYSANITQWKYVIHEEMHTLLVNVNIGWSGTAGGQDSTLIIQCLNEFVNYYQSYFNYYYKLD